MRSRSTLVLALLALFAAIAATALGASRSADNPALRAVAPTAAGATALPRCFGAASLDPGRPCRNPSLAQLVSPPPREARRLPNAPCTAMPYEGALKPCVFGAPVGQATETVALIGDSHAENWRGAVAAVARAKRWHAVSIALGGCPYSTITRVIPEPLRSHCAARNRDLPGWFERHPEVHTVFAAQISGVPFEVPPGQGQFEGQVKAYLDAWDALPPSVRHIILIRDTPKALPGTRRCIDRAIKHREAAGSKCRMPRNLVLDRDPAVAAAAQLTSPRVEVVDPTDHFCDRRWCYPVIGGALVQKDLNHLSAAFIETLGPYLLRDVDTLMSSWS